MQNFLSRILFFGKTENCFFVQGKGRGGGGGGIGKRDASLWNFQFTAVRLNALSDQV